MVQHSVLPIFPLPQMVLLPMQLLPLHIFEERYRHMLRDVLDDTGEIVVVQAFPSLVIADRNGPSGFANLPVVTMGCVGRIVEHEQLADGRSNVLLEGLHRVRVHEIDSGELYRKAEVFFVEASEEDYERTSVLELLSMRVLAQNLVEHIRKQDPAFELMMPSLKHEADIVDVYAAQLIASVQSRQRVLDTFCMPERVALTTALLAEQLHDLHEHQPSFLWS